MANGTAEAVNSCKGGFGTYVSENLTLCGKIPAATRAGYAAAWGLFFLIYKVLPLPEGLNLEGMAVLAFLIPPANARPATLMPVIQGITSLLGDTPEERGLISVSRRRITLLDPQAIMDALDESGS